MTGRAAMAPVSIFLLLCLLLPCAGASAAAGGGAAIAAASLGVAFAVDAPVRESMRSLAIEYPWLEEVASLLSDLGSLQGIGCVLTALWLADRELGVAAAQAAVRAGIATAALKLVAGRPRPHTEERGLRPLSLSDAWHSFPSGHAAMAFALAAAVGERRPDWREEAVALAALVALSRVVLDRHWASDVVAGAALGLAVGPEGSGRWFWSWTW